MTKLWRPEIIVVGDASSPAVRTCRSFVEGPSRAAGRLTLEPDAARARQ